MIFHWNKIPVIFSFPTVRMSSVLCSNFPRFHVKDTDCFLRLIQIVSKLSMNCFFYFPVWKADHISTCLGKKWLKSDGEITLAKVKSVFMGWKVFLEFLWHLSLIYLFLLQLSPPLLTIIMKLHSNVSNSFIFSRVWSEFSFVCFHFDSFPNSFYFITSIVNCFPAFIVLLNILQYVS